VQTDEPSPPVTPRTHTVDVVVAILLLVAHTTMAFLIAFFSLGLAMGTDACAYQACGDEQWVVRAIAVAWGVGALAVFVDVGLTGLLLANHRIAFYVPIVGCVLQFGIGWLALQMASWAGPIAS
jgi:hypothetical protein